MTPEFDLTKLTATQVRKHVQAEQASDVEGHRLWNMLTKVLKDLDEKPIGVRFKDKVILAFLDLDLKWNFTRGIVSLKITTSREYTFLLAYFDIRSPNKPMFSLDTYLHHNIYGMNSCYTIGATERIAQRKLVLAGKECVHVAKLARDAAKAVKALNDWEKTVYTRFPDSTPFTARRIFEAMFPNR